MEIAVLFGFQFWMLGLPSAAAQPECQASVQNRVYAGGNPLAQASGFHPLTQLQDFPTDSEAGGRNLGLS